MKSRKGQPSGKRRVMMGAQRYKGKNEPGYNTENRFVTPRSAKKSHKKGHRK